MGSQRGTYIYPRIPLNFQEYPRIPLEYPRRPFEFPRIPQYIYNIKILKDFGFNYFLNLIFVFCWRRYFTEDILIFWVTRPEIDRICHNLSCKCVNGWKFYKTQQPSYVILSFYERLRCVLVKYYTNFINKAGLVFFKLRGRFW